MFKERCILLVTVTCWFLLASGKAVSESAEVLPKGVNSTSLSYTHFFPIDKRYGADGNEEDAAIDFNANLNSDVFSDIAFLETAFSMPTGTGTLGTSDVDFEYNFRKFEFVYQYGLTDKLSIGVKIPYAWKRNKVDADINTANATLGINPAYAGPGDPPFIPIGFGGVPVTTEDIRDLLGDGLSINGQPAVAGYGFERFESWDDEGLEDIEAGARYQYHKSDSWRLAATGSISFPTGEVDDPDNLVDRSFGRGAYALIFAANNDYTGLSDWIFNATLRYDLVLPDKEKLRVPFDVNIPISVDEENVDRDIGDLLWLDLSAKYKYSQSTSFMAQYQYTKKWKDDISGDKGFAYDQLESETDVEQHMYLVGVMYSTLQKFKEKKASIPMKVGLTYRNRFKGRNNPLKSDYLKAEVAIYF